MSVMPMPSTENSDQPAAISTDTDHPEPDNLVPNSLNHEVAEAKPEIAEEEVRGFAEEEVRGVLEVIASTGKYWHDWGKLKSMISFHLKQILSEYPEAKMASEEQSAKLGETYQELVKRLDEALHGFDEGPPFTLQRLCEILLSARSIYPNLSKLALALEKDEPDKAHEEPQLQHNSIGNGIEPMAGDGDEIMAEVQEADIDDDMTIDMEAFEEIVGSAEQNSTPTGSS